MANNLLELPLEVLLNITSWLDTPSYGRLRLVSSALERSTFEAFAREFFGTKQFMITTFSLSTLLAISKHATLSKFVRKIIIGIEELIIRQNHSQALDEGAADQSNVIALGGLHRYLTAALRNLPNCHEIEVRDFESRTKQRDDGTWRSYGMKTWRKLGGSAAYHWAGQQQQIYKGKSLPTIFFNTIVNAIADSGIKCTYIGHVTRHDPNALQDAAFYLDALQLDPARKSLANLTSITLAIGASAFEGGSLSYGSKKQFLNLRKFLAMTPNLTRLRLNGDQVLRGQTHPFDEQVSCISETVRIAPITRLELGKLSLSGTAFDGLLDAFTQSSGKLEYLTLFRIILSDGSWGSTIDKFKALASWKSVTINTVAEVEITSRGLRLNQIMFKKDIADSNDKPHKLGRSVKAQWNTLSVSNHDARDAKTRQVTNLSGAFDVMSQGLVVMDRQWHKKHNVHDQVESTDESDGDSDGDDNSDADMLDTGSPDAQLVYSSDEAEVSNDDEAILLANPPPP